MEILDTFEKYSNAITKLLLRHNTAINLIINKLEQIKYIRSKQHIPDHKLVEKGYTKVNVFINDEGHLLFTPEKEEL